MRIHCANELIESVKNMNVMQSRMFYMILYKYYESVVIKQEFEEDDEIEIDIYEVKDIVKRRLSLNEILEPLEDMVNLNIEKYDFKERTIRYYNVFRMLGYDENRGVILFKINKDIREFIIGLNEKFTKIELEHLSILRKKHSIRMYEFYCRYKGLKKYKININDFRMFFNVPDSYGINHITKEILQKPIKELSMELGIIIDFEKIRRGKQIGYIEFKF